MKKFGLYTLLLGIFLCGFVVDRNSQDPAISVRFFILASLSATLFWFAGVPRNWTFYLYIGYLAFAIISLFSAVNPIEGLYEISKITIMLGLLMSASTILRDKELFLKIVIFMAPALVFCAFLSYQWWINICNRNLVASAAFLLLPLCLYSVKYNKEMGITFSALLLLLLVIIANRTSLLALGISSMAVGFMYRKTLKFILPSLLTVGLVLLIFWFPRMTHLESMRHRLEIWTETLRMFTEAPLGVGVGNWIIEMPRFATNVDIESFHSTLVFQRPHNDYLWVLAETGIMGFLCYVGIFASAIYYSAKSKNWMSLMGLTGYMVIAFFSFPKERAFHSLMLVIYLAMIIPSKKVMVPNRVFALTGMCILSILSAGFFLCYRTDIHIKKITTAKKQKDYDEVISQYEQCSKLRTLNTYGVPIAWYKSEAELINDNFPQAFISGHKAFEHNPNNVYVLHRMGDLYSYMNRYEQAERFYLDALKIVPDFEYSMRKLKNLVSKKEL